MKKFFILTALAFLPTVVSAEVVDGAGLFSPAAISQANAKIQAMQASTQKQLYIETVKTLDGANVDQAASQKLRERGIKGAVILISVNPKKIAVRVDQASRDVFTRADEEAALAAFRGGTRDVALNRMVDTCIAAFSKTGGTVTEPGLAGNEDKVAGDPQTEGKKTGSSWMTWLKGIGIVSAILFVLFIYIAYRIVKGILKAVFGMFKAPAQQPPTTYQGNQTPTTGGTYSPGGGGYAPQPSRGGGFVSTLLTGMLGAAAGSFIYDRVFGGGGSVFGAGSHDSGSSSSWGGSDSDSSSGSSSGWDSSSSGDSGSSSSWDSSDTGSSSGGDSGSSSDW